MFTKLTPVQKAFAAIIIANIIWGSAASIFKISLTNIPPFTLAFWRFFGGALLLVIVLRGKTALNFRAPRERFALTGYALTGITMNIIFFFWGLMRTHSINAPIIASSAPILMLLLAPLILKETNSTKKILGILLGSLGILTIVFQPVLEQGIDGSIVGNLFLILATLGAVFQTIIHRKFLTRFDPVKVTFWAFLVGAASFLPLAVSEYIASPNLYLLLDWRGYMGLGFGAIFSSALAYSLFAYGLTRVTATDSSLFTYLDPIVGTVMGAVLLSEPITGYFILGSVLIFGGIVIAEGHIPHYPLYKFRSVHAQKEIETVASVPSPSRAPVNKRDVLRNIFESPGGKQ